MWLFVIAFALRLLIEILTPARRRKRRREWPRRNREAERVDARAKLGAIAIVSLAVLEVWLWKFMGPGGRVLAVAIPVGLVLLAVWIVLIRHGRSGKVSQRTGSGGRDGGLQHPSLLRGNRADENVAVQEGEKGEAMVREVLKSLSPDRYVVLHNVWLPMEDGGETQIDHVVVSPFGIFIVETKNWKGAIYADEKSAVWTKFNHGRKDTYKNPIHQNYKHIVSVREKFSRSGSEFVFGVVAMSPAAEFRGGVPKGVVFYNELKGWILGHVAPCIKSEQVPDVVSAIQEWSATVSEEARRRHCEGAGTEDVQRLASRGPGTTDIWDRSPGSRIRRITSP